MVKTIISGNVVEVEDIFVKTVYGNTVPSATPAPAEPVPVVAHYVQPAAPVITTAAPAQVKDNYHVQSPPENNPPEPSNTPSPTPVAAPASSPAPAPHSSSNDGAPLSGGKSILESANYFRNLQGLPSFTYSSTLGANSAKTNNDDGGNSMTHELNSGSFAQCIAEGDDKTTSGSWSPFDLIYLGWLCEIPQSNLGDACNAMEAATHMLVDTADPGHANILRTAGYTKMGCDYKVATQSQPNYKGLWTCDFA